MLTCPPTRIGLTPSDTAEFDRRFQARRGNLRRRVPNGSLHLAQSPGRLARLGFVPANANIGRKRAESCSSRATVCTDGDEHEDQAESVDLHPPRPQNPRGFHADLTNEHGLPTPSPLDSCRGETADNANDSSPRQPLSPTRPEHTQHDARNVAASRIRSPSKSPSNQRGFLLYADRPDVQTQIERQHLTNWARQRGLDPETNVPTIVTQPPASSPLRDVQASDALPNPALDPGAPVFVPRTRFGSTLSSTTDNNGNGARSSRQGSSIGSAQTVAYLRVRSSFERNSQHSSPGHDLTGLSDENLLVPEHIRISQHRPRRRTNDQNAAWQRPNPNFDRYPVIRPQTASTGPRNVSNPHRQVALPRRQSSRQHLVEFERTRRPSQETGQHRATSSAQYSNLAPPIPHGGRRSVSPAASVSSQSTPNLFTSPNGPRFPVRSSSLRQNGPPRLRHVDVPSSNRIAQRSSESSASVHEDWFYRDSPLDELAQHLSRLAARPRSVGRSFERPPGGHGRVSLLTGDPFRLNTAPEPELEVVENVPEYATFEATVPVRSRTDSAVEPLKKSPPVAKHHARLSTEEDPVALALALPSPEMPSSPMSPTSPSIQQATPTPATLRSPISHSSTPRYASPPAASSTPRHASPPVSSSTPSAMTLNTAATTATPRVPVYNDRLPPTTQPQTPADIMRRNRGRSDAPVSTSSSRHHLTNETTTTTPTAHGRHRHTYPSSSAILPHQSPTHERMPVVIEQPATEAQHAVMHMQQRSSENEIEPGIEELEADRRVWVQRQEDGSLDVTPPAEGRFERYLS